MVWYSHLSQNFPQFLVIRTVKDFGMLIKAEIDVFLELSCFFHGPRDRGAWWAAVYGVVQSQTRLKGLSRSSGRQTAEDALRVCVYPGKPELKLQ